MVNVRIRVSVRVRVNVRIRVSVRVRVRTFRRNDHRSYDTSVLFAR
jgi:hypothetical protein